MNALFKPWRMTPTPSRQVLLSSTSPYLLCYSESTVDKLPTNNVGVHISSWETRKVINIWVILPPTGDRTQNIGRPAKDKPYLCLTFFGSVPLFISFSVVANCLFSFFTQNYILSFKTFSMLQITFLDQSYWSRSSSAFWSGPWWIRCGKDILEVSFGYRVPCGL